MPLYLFTVRRSKIDGIRKYVGMIPKLFSDLYMKEDYIEPKLLKNDYKYIFESWLKHPHNLIYRSVYLKDTNDRKIIINKNLELFDLEHFDENTFREFLIHLRRGHSNMEYGIYFGLLKAENKEDFLKYVIPGFDERTIIYYTEINNFLNYIDAEIEKYSFSTPILYFNREWGYGKKTEESMDYIPESREKFLEYLEHFKNEHLKDSEVICHLPFDINMNILNTDEMMFDFVYGTIGGGKKYKLTRNKRKYKNQSNKK